MLVWSRHAFLAWNTHQGALVREKDTSVLFFQNIKNKRMNGESR